jgi:hypothetical protein
VRTTKKALDEALAPSLSPNLRQETAPTVSSRPMFLYALAFLACILVSIAPIYRLYAEPMMRLPTNGLLILWGSWLPADLHLTTDAHGSRFATNTIFFLSLWGLAFVIYGLAAWYIHKQPVRGNYRYITRFTWLVTIITGCIFVITPALLSHDIFAYTAYGRILAYYHSNPYFIPFSAFPKDAFIPYDDWKNIPSAYGPVWEFISGLVVRPIGNHLARAIIIYRLLALIAHLLNALLIALILRKMGHSPRTVALGTLLYAWNPLVLEESCLGGHNDALMMTFILLGVFYSVHAEHNGTSTYPTWREYLAPILAFSLATLVKFSAAPVIALYLILLARKVFLAHGDNDKAATKLWYIHIPAVLKTIIPAGVISLIVLIGLYEPYWFGSGLKDVIYTFTATPSSTSSYGSMLFATIKWVQANDYPPKSSWTYPIVYIFSQHKTWSVIDMTALIFTLVAGAIWVWRSPTTRTLVLSILTMLELILLVTYWFFPWYLTWIVSLAALCIPARSRLQRATIVSTLMFSASSLSYYLYASTLPPFGAWNWSSSAMTLIPPVLTFIIFMWLPYGREKIAEQAGDLQQDLIS